ncbi:MAG: response regulator [bacterium]|nr:response regulator [bacterium]
MEQLTILIIDDNPDDQLIYQTHIKKDLEYEYLFLTADTADEGLSLYQSEKVDCILLDYQLPDSDGLEVLSQIGNMPDQQQIPPIIFLTGSGNEQLAVDSMKRGASDYIVKNDLNRDLIIKTIKYVIEKKNAEMARHRAFQELENRVLERTRELQQSNEAFRVAKETADAAVQLKKQFLDNVTHELMTPMTSILAGSELLLGKEISPEIDNLLEMVFTSAQDLHKLIKEILDVSKAEWNQIFLKPEPFLLINVFNSIRENFDKKFSEKQIEFSFTIEADVPDELLGDSTRLQQVIFNLMENAVKFTEKSGTVSLLVTVCEESLDNILLEFLVKDSGIGIAVENCQIIFQPFFQVDGSSTRKYSGVGLGLFLCRQLVEIMGGKMWVQSTLGEGSTFYFTVPLARKE